MTLLWSSASRVWRRRPDLLDLLPLHHQWRSSCVFTTATRDTKACEGGRGWGGGTGEGWVAVFRGWTLYLLLSWASDSEICSCCRIAVSGTFLSSSSSAVACFGLSWYDCCAAGRDHYRLLRTRDQRGVTSWFRTCFSNPFKPRCSLFSAAFRRPDMVNFAENFSP